MPNWGRAPSPQDLSEIVRSAAAFRELWASIQPPWPAQFDGTYTDIRAIDYLHYEGVQFPSCGAMGAALVCADVLRQAAGFEWMLSNQGDWFLVDDIESPCIAVCPLARLREMEFAGVPQYGRFASLVARAAFDSLLFCDADHASALQELITVQQDVLSSVQATLKNLRQPEI